MDLRLKGKNAVVFGSSSGIGKAVAFALAKEGVNVALLARRKELLQANAHEIERTFQVKAVPVVADLSSRESVENAMSEVSGIFKTLDILIYNLGGPPPGSVTSIEPEVFEKTFSTHLVSYAFLLKSFIPAMRKQKFGRVINILSISAKEILPQMTLSNTVRPAILGMSKTVAQECAKDGVTINSILPAAVLTDRTQFFADKLSNEKGISPAEALAEMALDLPIGRIAAPDEIANVVVFLCSPLASYVSGAAINVDAACSRGTS